MTEKLIGAFPRDGGVFQIEHDASSGSYFLGANWLLQIAGASRISVNHWPATGWQIDEDFQKFFGPKAASRDGKQASVKIAEISRQEDLGDSIMTAAVLAPF